MNRRNFMRLLGLGAATVSVAGTGVAAACLTEKRYCRKEHQQTFLRNLKSISKSGFTSRQELLDLDDCGGYLVPEKYSKVMIDCLERGVPLPHGNSRSAPVSARWVSEKIQ